MTAGVLSKQRYVSNLKNCNNSDIKFLQRSERGGKSGYFVRSLSKKKSDKIIFLLELNQRISSGCVTFNKLTSLAVLPWPLVEGKLAQLFWIALRICMPCDLTI